MTSTTRGLLFYDGRKDDIAHRGKLKSLIMGESFFSGQRAHQDRPVWSF